MWGDSYYLIEYRRKVDFDENLPGEGLLIWRVADQVVSAWQTFYQVNEDLASVNDDESMKGVRLEQADGEDHISRGVNDGDDGDPFPGSTGQFWLDAETTPRSFGTIALCEIRASGEGMKFKFLKELSCP